MADGMAARIPQRVWYFAATLDGKAVGRTTLFAGSETAGIYDVEVLKHARRRGIGTMLVHAALQHAVALGFRTTVLAATGAGQGAYERCGFREVGKISFWMYGRMRQAR
jgi:GNAT superfamily N-acetyltransferase